MRMKSRTIFWSCTACVWKNTAVDIHRGDLYIGAKRCGNNTNKSRDVRRKGQLVPMRTYLFVFMVDIACVREKLNIVRDGCQKHTA